jgi:hypothetical protein
MKWYSFIIINLFLFKIIFTEKNDYDFNIKKEEIKKGLKELNLSDKEEINQKEFLTLVKHLMNGGDKSKEESPKNNFSSKIEGFESQFESNFAREVLRGVPKKINVNDLPKYLDPKKLEIIMNKLLNNLNFNKMFKDIENDLKNLNVNDNIINETNKEDL